MKLRWHLIIFTLLTLLPVVLFAIGLMAWNASIQRDQSERTMRETTRALTLALDRELGKSEALLKALASSPLIDAGDFAALHRQASELGDGGWITIIKPDGEQLLNTLIPYGEPLPGAANAARLRRVVETERTDVSNLYVGALAKRPIVSIGVPVIRKGVALYSMDIAFGPERFTALLREQKLPAGWLANIYDTDGTVVARTLDPEQHVGQPSTAELVAIIKRAPEGFSSRVSREGAPVLGAWKRASLSGWTVDVVAPQDLVEAQLNRSMRLAVGGGLAFLIFGIVLAVILGRRITAPIAVLAADADSMGSGALVAQRPELRIAELQKVQRALADASRAARDRAAERERLAAEQSARIERARSDADLRRVALFNEAIMSNLGEGLYTLDERGLVTTMNPAAEELLGWSLAELRGEKMHDITHHHHPDGSAYPVEQCAAFQVLSSGQRLVNHEDEFIRKDGTFLPVIYSMSPMRDSTGKITGVVVAFSDIGERRRADAALLAAMTSAEQARADAEKANQAKDQFLAVLSHELRTPLTPVLAAVQLLQRRPGLTPDAREPLEIVQRNIQLQARLIDDLLDLTRIAQGKLELKRKPIDICTVIERAVEIAKPDIDARRLAFGVVLKDAPHRVDGDESRLQQVIWNLLTNAVKFTPEGGCVGLRCERQGQLVIIEVSDSGIGIEPEAADRIFDAFEQGGRAVTRQFGGLGLGLAIVKRLVEMHEGTISVQSEGRSRGSKFRVALPVSSAEPVTEATKDIEVRSGTSRRILLVEDNGDTAAMMKMLLEVSGYEVETAGDVAQALKAIESDRFDILLSDLGLPDRSGIELMQELRRLGVPLKGIALTGYGQDKDIHRCKEAGFSAHLVKPVDVEVLMETISRVVGSAEGISI